MHGNTQEAVNKQYHALLRLMCMKDFKVSLDTIDLGGDDDA